MAIDPVMNRDTSQGASGNRAVTGNSKLAGNSASELQDNFLKLLLAQLQNQDPTNPMQNNELTTQLAQISTVQGIENLNKTMGAISGQIDKAQSMQASALIGHGVMIPGSTILLGSSSTEEETEADSTRGREVSTTPFGVELQQPADKVTVTISDQSGKVVRTIEIGELKAGVHSFSWDGSMNEGEEKAPDGAYSFSIAASSGGTQMKAQPLHFAMVQGVIRNNNGSSNELDLGMHGKTTLDEVRQIL